MALPEDISANGAEVKGLAYLDGKIYVIHSSSKAIKVFRFTSENEFSDEGEIKNILFNTLLDIVSCKKITALYILDLSSIWQLDTHGDVTAYVQLNHVYSTISISGRNLLVTGSRIMSKCRHRFILKPSLSRISLPEGLSNTKPLHALEIDSTHVISHVNSQQLHLVSKLKETGRDRTTIERSMYGKEAGVGDDQVNNPVYLALEPKNGHIFVADHDNSRVVVLDGNLSRRLMILNLPERCYPSRLCYVEDRRKLIVGMSNGLVIGYKFTR